MPKYYEEERKREAKDGSMLTEDHGAIANMPQTVKYHDWPKAHDYMEGNLDDTITGINKQIGEDESGARRHRKNNKW